MKFNLLDVTMFTVGVILMWAAIKDLDPRHMVQNALQGKTTTGPVVPHPHAPTTPGPRPKLVVPFTPPPQPPLNV